MKCIIFYAYPPEPDGQSLQGHMLYQGILKQGINVIPCHFQDGIQKQFYLKHFKPDFAIGVGFWGNVPDVVREPWKYNVTPVPWFNADGWVANYKEDFEKLPLMFTTSEWVKSIYKRDGINVDKIIPMHIGIDTDFFKPTNNPYYNKSVKEMLGIKENEKMILTVGGDVTSKGAQEMFRALVEVDKEYKNWKYVCKSWPSSCASEWHEHEMEIVEQLGIKDKVIFVDDVFSQEFMVDLLNSCDIYAAPSRIEGFGMIQVEAMACEKPVISINKMGPAETIIHNKTGFLADVAEEVVLNEEWAYSHMGFSQKKIIKFDKPKTFAYRASIDDLKKYTLKLLTEPELGVKMGIEGRKHVVENLDYRIISKKMISIIKEKLKLK